MKFDPPNMFVAVCQCCGSQGSPATTRGAAIILWDERNQPGDTYAFCKLCDRLAGASSDPAAALMDATFKALPKL